MADYMRRHSPYNYAFDNPIMFIDPDGMWPEWPSWSEMKRSVRETINDLAEFSAGLADAVVSNNLSVGELGIQRTEGRSGSYAAGQTAGDIISVAQGAIEMIAGGTLVAGGGTLEVTTLGAASPIAIPAVAAGVGVITHGTNVASNGLYNLFSNGSGKIYKVPGEDTPSGDPYVGRTKQSSPKKRGKSDGRDRSNAEIIDEYDPKNPGEGAYKEQKAMDDNGGVGKLDNKRREVNKERMKELEKKYKDEKGGSN